MMMGGLAWLILIGLLVAYLAGWRPDFGGAIGTAQAGFSPGRTQGCRVQLPVQLRRGAGHSVLIPENDPASWEADPAGGQPTEHGVTDRQVQPVGWPPSRGWGFFLIEKAAPDSDGAGRHLLALFLHPGGK